jgi:hypothetical protein
MNMGDQFAKIILAKSQLFDQVAQELAKDISAQSITNTRAGESFSDADRYDNLYAVSTSKAKGMASRGPVTLRNGRNRIESQKVTVIGKGMAQIAFTDSEAGQIFRYHHEGINYKNGNRMRSIFPKTITPELLTDAMKRVHEVLK